MATTSNQTRTVAIAGGASPNLGRSIVTGILSLAPSWKITILSRRSSPIPAWLPPVLEGGRAKLRRVDYADRAGLVAALRGAHTVISAIGFNPYDPSWLAAELALLSATVEAGGRRFAPSEYGIGVLATPKIDAFRGSVEVWEACARSGLEWTRFECGLFMNYLGFGVPEERGSALREAALGGRDRDGEWLYFSSCCRAELPVKEDGQTFPRVTMTAIEDVGKMVARSLDLGPGEWETTSNIVGETLRMDEVVRIAERVMGRRWEVRRVSVEELERAAEGEEDEVKRLWAQMGLAYARDAEGEGWFEGGLNRLFPEVEMLSVEAYLSKYYGSQLY